MIFASVGSMLPFDRLVRAVDAWAGTHPSEEVFVQIGDGEFEPQHAAWARIVPHSEYRQRLEQCDLFVAHVGMGSILQALEIGKQMLLLPRLASQREVTTDHQLHTAQQFGDKPGVMIVSDELALQTAISDLLSSPLERTGAISQYAQPELIKNIANFLGSRAQPESNG